MDTGGHKRSREGDGEGPAPKIARLSGIVAGPNWLRYPPWAARTTIPGQPPFTETGEKEESPPQNRRFWQNHFGQTVGGVDWQMSPSQQMKWLQSNPQWANGLNDSWRGTRVLGMGGYGLVGLWEYVKPTGEVSRVVVKQSKRRDAALKRESILLRGLSQTRTRHVVRLLKRYHEEVGMGTSDWDSDKHCISRIYLEFCENGDMKGLIKRVSKHYDKEKTFIPEVYIWLIWECLARGLCVMQNGNEGLDDSSWDEPEVVHLDIKPNNILVGGKDNEHTMMDVVKFADFGLSLPVPDRPDHPRWLERVVRRGTPNWLAPEQVDSQTPNRMVGTPTNVWGVAKCMYLLLRHGRSLNTENHFKCHLLNSNIIIETYGRKLLRPEFDCYSEALRTTIFRCLARDPTHRPTPRELLSRCQESLKAIEPGFAPFPGIPPGQAGDEPEDSPQNNSAWFSSSGREESSSVRQEEDQLSPSMDVEEQQEPAPHNPGEDPAGPPQEWMDRLSYGDGV